MRPSLYKLVTASFERSRFMRHSRMLAQAQRSRNVPSSEGCVADVALPTRLAAANDKPQPPRIAWWRRYITKGVYMYGHPPHTGIGSMVLTLVASAKGGIGFLVRVIAHAQHAH
jgi:hypothetical protein